jgi:hypothetical protein
VNKRIMNVDVEVAVIGATATVITGIFGLAAAIATQKKSEVAVRDAVTGEFYRSRSRRGLRRSTMLAIAAIAALIGAGSAVVGSKMLDEQTTAGTRGEPVATYVFPPTTPTITTTTPSTPAEIDVLDRMRPGCAEADPTITWTVVDATISCSSNGTVVEKLKTYNGDKDAGWGEVRFAIRGQSFPARYSVSVTVSDFSDPRDEQHTQGCAGAIVHTTPDGATSDNGSVCGNGQVSVERFGNWVATGRQNDSIPTGVVPGGAGTYRIRLDVSPAAVALTVDNNHSSTRSITMSPISFGTSFIGLVVDWHYPGAHVTFSNFHYNAA